MLYSIWWREDLFPTLIGFSYLGFSPAYTNEKLLLEFNQVLTSRKKKACYWVKENMIFSSSCLSFSVYSIWFQENNILLLWSWWILLHILHRMAYSVSASVVSSLSPVTLLIPLQRNSIKIIFCFGENELNL